MAFRFRIAKWIIPGLLLMALTGCGELYHQPAYRPQDAPRLVPPPGAVPVSGVERDYTGVDGKNLANPYPKSQASLERGRSVYNTNCAPCHGAQGKGDGPVAPAYVPKPADLTASKVQDLTDGEVFLRITNGFSTMPAFRRLLAAEDRWHAVNHVRALGGR